jgi:DNA polymerase III subunit delta'
MTLPPWLEAPFTNLVAALTGSRLPHALLIHGPGGWGEWGLADALALQLIERDYRTSAPAGTVAHPDLRWVVPEGAGEQIKIDAVRSIADFIVQTPQIAPRKVAVIAGAEAMNQYAANALLKTLEEPPPNSYLILVSDALSEMLPTLRSRCQLVAIRPSDTATTLAWVRDQTSAADADLVTSLGFEYGGAPYRLLAALERNEQPIAVQLCDVVRRRQDPLALAEAWARGSTIELIERWMRYVPVVLTGRQVPVASPGDALIDALASASRQRVLGFWEQLAAARGLLRGTTNPNARLLLEALLMDWRDLAQRL